jgi:hypothetical protein
VSGLLLSLFLLELLDKDCAQHQETNINKERDRKGESRVGQLSFVLGRNSEQFRVRKRENAEVAEDRNR